MNKAKQRINEIFRQSIDEIEKQSYTEVMHERGGTYMTFDKQKFAELIVKKCANIVWDEAERTMSSEVNDAGYKIIEYFGVAEREE